jgi:hypothetical protein
MEVNLHGLINLLEAERLVVITLTGSASERTLRSIFKDTWTSPDRLVVLTLPALTLEQF